MSASPFVNLTPHDVVVRREGLPDLTIPRSGQVARVAEARSECPPCDGVPTVRIHFGRIRFGTPGLDQVGWLIVSATVLAAARSSGDPELAKKLLAPDTGSSAVRDEAGRIVAVRGFVRV